MFKDADIPGLSCSGMVSDAQKCGFISGVNKYLWKYFSRLKGELVNQSTFKLLLLTSPHSAENQRILLLIYLQSFFIMQPLFP